MVTWCLNTYAMWSSPPCPWWLWSTGQAGLTTGESSTTLLILRVSHLPANLVVVTFPVLLHMHSMTLFHISQSSSKSCAGSCSKGALSTSTCSMVAPTLALWLVLMRILEPPMREEESHMLQTPPPMVLCIHCSRIFTQCTWLNGLMYADKLDFLTDYDCPVSESGQLTDKFYEIRNILHEMAPYLPSGSGELYSFLFRILTVKCKSHDFFPVPDAFPEPPEPIPSTDYGEIPVLIHITLPSSIFSGPSPQL